jgi:TPP-dependent pyruvate/acetoin dehydrogenase alpha subunit
MKEITKETYLKWYEDMLFWRKFEDKLAAVYIQQKVRGFLHLYNGQEAVLAGALHVIDSNKDRMITAYRNHVMPIGMGVDPKRVMAELYGKSTWNINGSWRFNAYFFKGTSLSWRTWDCWWSNSSGCWNGFWRQIFQQRSCNIVLYG